MRPGTNLCLSQLRTRVMSDHVRVRSSSDVIRPLLSSGGLSQGRTDGPAQAPGHGTRSEKKPKCKPESVTTLCL